MTESDANDLSRELDELGGNLSTALQELPIPAVVLDADGVVRWENPAAEAARGDLVGLMFSEFVAPGDLGHAQEIFARILCNGEPAEFTVQIRDPAGGFSPVEISSAPLRGNGSVVGVFGLGRERAPTSRPNENGETSVCATTNLLTPRQLEVVRLLAAGLSTRDIAAALHLSSTTVRNHVAMILATLGVHTRLQAVMAAQARGLLDG